MKNQKGISMITLIITIIVMIILAAIAFMAAGDQVGSAQFSGFATEFGDYATNFQNSAYADVTEGLGLAGKASNKAQKLYMAARGIPLSDFDAVLNGVTRPGGYTFAQAADGIQIKDGTGAAFTTDTFEVCYQIVNNAMAEYAPSDLTKDHNFYGNANGLESHWVTNKGLVFTLPGFPRNVDGEDRMYITPDLYYVSPDGEKMMVGDTNAGHMTAVDPVTVGGDVVTGGQDAVNAMGFTYTETMATADKTVEP